MMIFRNRAVKRVAALLMAAAMCIPVFFGTSFAEGDSELVEYNGHMYLRIEQGMSWQEAKQLCESLGGHLATITSEGEQEFVKRLVSGGSKDQYWLGATDEAKEGDWKWITGEEFVYWATRVTFNNYNGNEHYLQMQRHHWGDANYLGVWNDINKDNYISGQTVFFSTDRCGLICEFESLANNQNNGASINVPANADLRYFNGHTYLVVYEPATPEEAERFCAAFGGHLATVTSEEENNFLKTLFEEKREVAYILGGTDRNTEGVWEWMNGEPWSFSYWDSPTEPNNGLGAGENYLCAGARVNWKWVDFFGKYDGYSSKFPYVCEWESVIGQGDVQQGIGKWTGGSLSGTYSAVAAAKDGYYSGVNGQDNYGDGKNIFYVEHIDNKIYITYYHDENATSVYGSISADLQSPEMLAVGQNWFNSRTGHPDVLVSIRFFADKIEISRFNASGVQRDTLYAKKISDSVPAGKVFNENKDPAHKNQNNGSTGNAAEPTPDKAIEVKVESGVQAATAKVFNGVTGVTVSFNQTGALGYRLFRSTNPQELGISVTDFYITSNNFTDVNVQPSTQYYYTLVEVAGEADPLNGVSERHGNTIAKWSVRTAAAVNAGGISAGSTKRFIMLKLDDPKMSVDGIEQEIDPGKGTAPVIVRGRTMLPIRAVVEAMGGAVGWNGSNKEVSLTVGSTVLKLWLGKSELSKNSAIIKIDVPPMLINNRTCVPLRFAAENLNCQIEWINSTKSIVIVWTE